MITDSLVERCEEVLGIGKEEIWREWEVRDKDEKDIRRKWG